MSQSSYFRRFTDISVFKGCPAIRVIDDRSKNQSFDPVTIAIESAMLKIVQLPLFLRNPGSLVVLFLLIMTTVSYQFDDQLFSMINRDIANHHFDGMIPFVDEFGLVIQSFMMIVLLT